MNPGVPCWWTDKRRKLPAPVGWILPLAMFMSHPFPLHLFRREISLPAPWHSCLLQQLWGEQVTNGIEVLSSLQWSLIAPMWCSRQTNSCGDAERQTHSICFSIPLVSWHAIWPWLTTNYRLWPELIEPLVHSKTNRAAINCSAWDSFASLWMNII